ERARVGEGREELDLVGGEGALRRGVGGEAADRLAARDERDEDRRDDALALGLVRVLEARVRRDVRDLDRRAPQRFAVDRALAQLDRPFLEVGRAEAVRGHRLEPTAVLEQANPR